MSRAAARTGGEQADRRIPNMVIMQYISVFFSGFILSTPLQERAMPSLTHQSSCPSP